MPLLRKIHLLRETTFLVREEMLEARRNPGAEKDMLWCGEKASWSPGRRRQFTPAGGSFCLPRLPNGQLGRRDGRGVRKVA
jgi:hypothetical protein